MVQQGACEVSSLATMRNLLDAGLVDVDDPAQSLLLLKPLSDENGGVPHGGHAEFYPASDPGYDNFLYWLTRYAECQKTKG